MKGNARLLLLLADACTRLWFLALVSNYLLTHTMTSTQKQNVVVVGGGSSGVAVAQGLSKQLDHSRFNLILIEPRPRHIWLPATARMVVTSDEKFIETVRFPFDRLFANGKGVVRQDKVVSIKEGKGEEASELNLASGETLQYRGEYAHPPPPRVSHFDTLFYTSSRSCDWFEMVWTH